MPHTARHLALLATLTLTFLVAPAHGFNVLRETRQLPRMRASETVERSTKEPKFVIILDAGSSGTKVNVFKFDFDANSGGGGLPSDVTEIPTGKIKVKPALHTLADNSTTDLEKYLCSIFNKLKSTEESKQLTESQTVLYLLATAGMRELEKSDKSKANTLMDNVKSILSKADCNAFDFKNATIMSGMKEGVYAWLAANFLNNFFNTDMDRDASVGLLEMGGSSLQLAYMPPTRSEEGCDVVVTSDQTKELHVHSYARFGANAINQQIVDGLCNGGGDVENPCMLTGDSANLACDGEQKVTVNGTSDPATCRGKLDEIVNQVTKAAADGLLFYAIGSLRFALKTLKAVDSDVLNVTKLGQEADVYCSKTWEEAKEIKGSAKYVSSDCTVGLFLDELLEQMGLDDNTIKVTQTINEKPISWALGAAMDMLTKNINVTCGVTK